MMTDFPVSKVNLSTCGLMLVLMIPGHFLRASYSISLSKCPMLPIIALFFILAISEALMMFLFPVAVTKISIWSTTSSSLTTS